MTPARYKILLIYLREMRTVLQKVYTGGYTKDIEIDRWAGSIEQSLDRIKERANEEIDID